MAGSARRILLLTLIVRAPPFSQWTWSHINLGKIFDVTGSRDRPVNEYNLAICTKGQRTERVLREGVVTTLW